jgi:pimeloyl-ACP methyl ester carboxylesterase
MAPTAPRRNRNLVWHTYSGQAFSIFHGDLDFYFGGWDGRGRIEHIDTRRCPVYMLTGEYDWSNTPEMSRITAAKIPGAKFSAMSSLGHFPATENPPRFVGYLLEALNFIVQRRTCNSKEVLSGLKR